MGIYSKIKVCLFALFFSMLKLEMSRSVLMHKGNESQPVAYQKLPPEKKKEKKKVDRRNATI